MMRAALYAAGKVVTADSHLEAWRKLSDRERDDNLVSGFFDPDTDEFVADREQDHFYDKEMILIRHAEPANDDPDPDLSETGYCQINDTLSRLRNLDLQGFTGLCSPFLRCLRSAAAINEIWGIPFRIAPELMEIANASKNKFCIRNRSDIYPQFEWPSEKQWELKFESANDFQTRVKSALQHLPAKSIVVCHCGFICSMAVLALCQQKSVNAEKITYASVTCIRKQTVNCLG